MVRLSFRRHLGLSAAIILIFVAAPIGAHAALYSPGATLNPACKPTDANCGVATSAIASGTTGQVPYYSANGRALTATSTFTILSNGHVGIGTSSPVAMLAVQGNAYIAGNATTTGTAVFSGNVKISGTISTQNPIDVFDNFSGPADGPVTGRTPVIGSYAWNATGPGYAGAYAGAGVMGSTNDNGGTYYEIQSPATPWEVTATFKNASASPHIAIAVIKDWTNHQATVMWHTEFTSNGITSTYWNATWNGAASNVSGQQPTWKNSINTACPTLQSGVSYVARIVLNPPYADDSIETTDGSVLCTERTYEPLMADLIGPFVYVQSTNGETFSSFAIHSKPSTSNLLYGQDSSGLDGTAIGASVPAAGNFSSLTVGSSTPRGLFTVTTNSVTDSDMPTFYSPYASKVFLEAGKSGYGSSLILKNGSGATGSVAMTAGYSFTLTGYDGSPFLTKPPFTIPYFASDVAFGGTTSSYPKIKRDGAGLDFRLADDSGYATTSAQGGLFHGSVAIGTSSPATLLEVGGSSSNVTFDAYKNCSGFTTNGSGLLSCTASDERLKQDITGLNASSTIVALNELKPVSFYWRPGTKRGNQQQFGLVAQDVQQIFPNLVSTTSPTALTPNGTLTLNYSGLIAPIIVVVQGLFKEISGFAHSITSEVGNFGRVNTQKLCLTDSSGSTCYTRSQLASLLQSRAATKDNSVTVSNAQQCSLSASPESVAAGGHVVLAWSAPDTGTFSINQGVGDVSPAISGTTTSKAIDADTTFVGTATSPKGDVGTCSVLVSVTQSDQGAGPSNSQTTAGTSTPPAADSFASSTPANDNATSTPVSYSTASSTSPASTATSTPADGNSASSTPPRAVASTTASSNGGSSTDKPSETTSTPPPKVATSTASSTAS